MTNLMTPDDQQMVNDTYDEYRRLKRMYRRARANHQWADAERLSADIYNIEKELGLR